MRQKYEYESIPAQDIDDHELPSTAQAENVAFRDPQSPVLLDAMCLPYAVDVDLRLPANEAGLEHALRLQVSDTATWVGAENE